MFCTNCGSQLADGLKFCTQCGTPVDVAETPAQATPAYESPAQAAPAYEAPAQAAPAYEAPAQAAPAYEAPAQAAPAYEAPAQAAPVYNAETYSYSGSEAPAQDPGAGLGKASKILGIIGLVLMCGYAGAPLSITALILGCIGLNKSKNAGFENKSAKTGRTLGIIGVIFIPIVIVIGIVLGVIGGLAESSMYYY